MKTILLSCFFVFSALTTWAQPKVVAHRGYWRTEGSAQNSIESFRQAARVGCWGSEFDVWITADGVPVVFHDATIGGIRIEDTTYATLMNHRLANGEFIPTLQQFLLATQAQPECRLILEIKSHRNARRETLIVERTLELIRMLGLEARTDYISFSRFVCEKLHQEAPEAHVAYLSGDLTPQQVKDLGLTGIDYHIDVFKKNPTWATDARKLGLEVNVWTVDGEEALRYHAALPGIDLITTNDPELLLNILNQ